MEAINKQREQLKDIKTNKQTNKQKQLMGNIKKKEKLEEILLLTNNLNGILMTYDINFTKKGENILKNLVIDKKIINYQNLLFKTDNPIIDNNFDFFKRFGTLYDLLTDLLNRKISTIKVKKNKMKW